MARWAPVSSDPFGDPPLSYSAAAITQWDRGHEHTSSLGFSPVLPWSPSWPPFQFLQTLLWCPQLSSIYCAYTIVLHSILPGQLSLKGNIQELAFCTFSREAVLMC